MWRLRLTSCIAPALLALAVSATGAAGADFLIFPLKVSLPVNTVVIGMETDQVAKTTLKEKEIVNLALGRPLATKVDKKTEVLALAIDFAGAAAKVVVFNPAASGAARLTTTVALTTLDFASASTAKGKEGQGTATLTVQETTLGTPTQFALRGTTALATGLGKASPFVPPGLDVALSVQGFVAGRLTFTAVAGGQPTTFAGFVVNGKAKASGKPLALVTE